MSFGENDPSEEEIPSQKEHFQEEQERKRSVFAHVGNFFGWLGELINEQARLDAQKEDDPVPLPSARDFNLQQQNIGEVIAKVEAICNNLDEVKEKLLSEFGSNAAGFISKCIDPMVNHARSLTYGLRDPQSEPKDLHSLLSQAIESVELYSQYSDEVKLKKRIVQVAQDLIKQAIDKDLEILANYKQSAIQNSPWNAEERQVEECKIDGCLYPVVSELLGMSGSRLETDDLRAFFVWKSTVDDRRNSLVELGLLTIDAMTYTQEERPPFAMMRKKLN